MNEDKAMDSIAKSLRLVVEFLEGMEASLEQVASFVEVLEDKLEQEAGDEDQDEYS